MIRASAIVRTKPLALFRDYLREFNNNVFRIGNEVVNIHRSDLLGELSQEPGPVATPIEWTSDKQRRAFFASDGFGHGIPYQRSGRLAQSWQILTFEESGRYTFIVVNPSPVSKFVYGTLQKEAAAMNPRQKFHANTGWIEAKPIVDRYTMIIVSEIMDRLRSELGEFGSVTGTGQSAFTG